MYPSLLPFVPRGTSGCHWSRPLRRSPAGTSLARHTWHAAAASTQATSMFFSKPSRARRRNRNPAGDGRNPRPSRRGSSQSPASMSGWRAIRRPICDMPVAARADVKWASGGVAASASRAQRSCCSGLSVKGAPGPNNRTAAAQYSAVQRRSRSLVASERGMCSAASIGANVARLGCASRDPLLAGEAIRVRAAPGQGAGRRLPALLDVVGCRAGRARALQELSAAGRG